jgi:hypothetical protein
MYHISLMIKGSAKECTSKAVIKPLKRKKRVAGEKYILPGHYLYSDPSEASNLYLKKIKVWKGKKLSFYFLFYGSFDDPEQMEKELSHFVAKFHKYLFIP